MKRFTMENKKDVEEAASYIAKYISPSGECEPGSSDFAKLAYGINLANIANMLYEQDDFMNRKMPHICKYLQDLNIDCRFIYYRPSDIIPDRKIIEGMVNPDTFKNYARNSNKLWNRDDLIYTDDSNRNYMNPFNIFYRVDMYIDTSNVKEMFIDKISEYFLLPINKTILGLNPII